MKSTRGESPDKLTLSILLLLGGIWTYFSIENQLELNRLRQEYPTPNPSVSNYTPSEFVGTNNNSNNQRVNQPRSNTQYQVGNYIEWPYNEQISEVVISTIEKAEDEYWEIETQNGKFYRVRREDWEGTFGADEFDREEPIGFFPDLYRYSTKHHY